MTKVLNPYRELAPPATLAERVECFWTAQVPESYTPSYAHRVFPDGCMDFLYTRDSGKSELALIGAMTRFGDHPPAGGSLHFGVRFRPGGLRSLLPEEAHRWTDTAPELAALTPRDARLLKQRLDAATTPDELASVFSSLLPPAPAPDPVQNALACLEQNRGLVDLEWLASQAALGERQFRRICQARTGLPPKQLSRILRFRHALSQLRAGRLTDVALDCGYYDQSHFIHEFRQLTGMSPTSFLSP